MLGAWCFVCPSFWAPLPACMLPAGAQQPSRSSKAQKLLYNMTRRNDGHLKTKVPSCKVLSCKLLSCKLLCMLSCKILSCKLLSRIICCPHKPRKVEVVVLAPPPPPRTCSSSSSCLLLPLANGSGVMHVHVVSSAFVTAVQWAECNGRVSDLTVQCACE